MIYCGHCGKAGFRMFSKTIRNNKVLMMHEDCLKTLEARERRELMEKSMDYEAHGLMSPKKPSIYDARPNV